ncbi:MAG: hypothetical protein DHS20C16_33900 [Phycisphaerae bacterium]|nr:MAG: hypothetical protein DHS20C16_33900 [Phycisphaerae bacterium]
MDNRNFALARDTLWGTQLDRRDWAWGFLMNRLDQDLYTIPNFVAGAMSPDGQRIAAISISHPITIFDSNDGSMILEFDPLTRRLTNEVEFSPDGRHLVGACLDRRVRVWDTSNGALLLTLRGHLGTLNSTTYDASGQRIVSAGGMSARVWDATTGDAISAFRGHCNGQPDCRVWRAGFVPDSALAYSYGNDGFVRLWDAKSGEERLAFEGGNVVVDASGSLIGVTSGVTVHVWNIETGAQQCELTGHRAQVGRLAFSPSGEEIYSTSEDGTIRCWDTDSGVERRVFLHPGRSHRLAFSSDGTLLAAVNSDGLIKIWDLDGNEEINSFRSQNRLAYSLAFFANDTKLMTGARESQVMAWGVGQGIGQAPIATLDDGVQNFDLSEDNSHIAVVGRDNVVSLLRSDNGATEAALTSFDYRARSAVAVSHTGRYVVAATDQFVPLFIDAENLEVIRPLEGHDGPVKSLTFSPSSQFILSTSWDRTARLWDGISGAPVRSFVGHTATVTQGRFRPNSDQILTTSKDGTARLWDAATGAVIHVYEGHDGTVLDADWASNGSSFVTSSEDQRLRIWDARTHQLIRTIELGRASGFVRFSADGDLLFTQANDRGTNVWRVATGEPLVDRLAFEPLSPTLIAPMNDAQTLIVAGSEQSSIWKIEAAPWTDMGERENDWRDRHEQYRIAQRALGPSQSTEQDRSGIPMVIATNTETLRERVGRFLRVLDGEVDGPLNQGNAGALRLTGARKNALARLCFLEGDRITAIGGSPVQDRTTAMAAVEAWTDSGGNELRLTLSRGNKQFDVRIFALPLRQEERALTLERSDAITIIGALVNARGGSLDVAGQLSQEFVDDSGEEIDSPQSLFGFPYTLADTPPLNEYSLRLGLAMGDWIRSINGVPVRNMEALLDQLEGIVDLLEDGENLNLTIDIERGEFIRLSNTIEIR